jgi:hypothetical protein
MALCCDRKQCISETSVKRLTELLTKFNGPTLILATRVALGPQHRPSHKTLQPVLHDWLKDLEGENSFTELAFDFEEYRPLHSASGMGEGGLVSLLLSCGVDIGSVDGYRRTALHYAARSGHEAVVELLLQGGAGIEMRDEDGATPLAHAIENGSKSVNKLLLARGAKADYLYEVDVGEFDTTPVV